MRLDLTLSAKKEKERKTHRLLSERGGTFPDEPTDHGEHFCSRLVPAAAEAEPVQVGRSRAPAGGRDALRTRARWAPL